MQENIWIGRKSEYRMVEKKTVKGEYFEGLLNVDEIERLSLLKLERKME